MQNEKLSSRTQFIIEQLEKLWQHLQEPSPEVLKQVTEFIVGLQEPYRTIGLEKIAERAISNMSIHILDLMATFQQRAEKEGISLEDCKETFDHINPTTFQILRELSKHISVHSLDDLAALSNITDGLQTLSQVSSAEEAQSWLYELPTMYYQQLAQENLVVNVNPPKPKEISVKVSQVTFATNWIPYDTAQGIVLSETGRTTIPSENAIAPMEHVNVRVYLGASKKTTFRAA